MIINMIAAMAANRVVGRDNKLPRNYPQDLQHFKHTTSGHVVVMGRKTFESIGRKLPNRRNIILSRTPVEEVETYADIDTMMKQLQSENIDQIFIIGGASIYSQFLPIADFIYLTEIKKVYDGDATFPMFEQDFVEVERKADESGEMDFVLYKRK